MLDPIEKSFEEHVVLLFVGEFHWMLGVKGAHQFAELLFVDFVISLFGEASEVADEGVVEALLSLSVVLVQDGPFEQILHECCHTNNWDVVVSFKVEEQGSENLEESNG